MSQSEDQKRSPLFTVAKWYGYVFAIMFTLYGGLKIVLGFLDRNTTGWQEWMMFAMLGVVVAVICFAFRDGKTWGWYGMIGFNGLVVLLALFGLSQSMNIILLVCSLGMIGLLFHPQTKQEIFSHR